MKSWFVWGETPVRTILEWSWQKGAVDRLILSGRLTKYGQSLEDLKPGVHDSVSEIFGDKLLETKLARRWPGTELFDHQGVVFRIAFDPSCIERMAEAGELLRDWKHSHKPPLPEDPCLHRSGAERPLFFSVTHEDSGWIISDERPPFSSGEPREIPPGRPFEPSAEQEFVEE